MQRKSFEVEKDRISTSAESTDDQRKGVFQTLSDLTQLSGQRPSLERGSAGNTSWNCDRHYGTSLDNIGNWLAQAK